ncbi:MAG: tetratricopeptide repeat protein, partial [Aristaeellaceae bacterium]
EEALGKFDRYLEDTGQDSDYYPVALFLRAACVMQLDRFEEAEEGFRQAIDFGYEEAACKEQIMLCSFELGEYQQAAQYGVELLETEARLNTPELTYQRLGASMMMLERYEEAVKYLDEAEKLELELTGNAYYRGVSLLALHRYDEAVADFSKSIEQGFLTQFCYYNRGVCYVQLLDYDKAAQDMEMTLTSGQDAELIEAAREIIFQIEEYNKNNMEKP